MDLQEKHRELRRLEEQAKTLRAEIYGEEHHLPSSQWPPAEFYGAYFATTGFMLGGFAAIVSLLANVLGAPAAGKSPLELIKIYLTFPLGQQALHFPDDQATLLLAFGCCLYVGTGMVLGVPMFYGLARICGSKSSLVSRLIVSSFLSLIIWLVAFYGVLSWLHPMLLNGTWITDGKLLPWWVAAGTHLIFGWTLAVLYPLGEFTPYRTYQVGLPSTLEDNDIAQ